VYPGFSTISGRAKDLAPELGCRYALQMGLLDDAIREHLDLKRRRGADPTEVERDEREALGPVRRAPENQPSAEAASGSRVAPFAYDQEEDWSDDPLPDAPPSRARRSRAAPEPDVDNGTISEDEPEAAEEPRPSRLARIFGKPGPQVEPEPEPEEEDEDEPEPHDEVKASRPRPTADAEPADPDTEEAPEPAKPQKDEDVLEETPEFLQDTPDHDRLWFEQRPPKDFDFDG
jgi:hypothetical protein